MLDALLTDLEAVTGHRPDAVLTEDRAGAVATPPSETEIVPLPPRPRAPDRESPGPLFWPVAPETRGVLARITEDAEAKGFRVVGSPPEALRRASERARLLGRLRRAGIPVPRGGPAASVSEARGRAGGLGFPVVVKPGRGAGGAGTRRVRTPEQVRPAWREARDVDPNRAPLVQEYLDGPSASVALLTGRGGPLPLALSRQHLRFRPEAVYEGGSTPFRHPDAEVALERARDACRLVPGLRGLVGVDLVLTPAGPVILEINPRITTSYLGLRAHLGPRLAKAALASGLGRSPPLEALGPVPLAGRTVRFSAAGGP